MERPLEKTNYKIKQVVTKQKFRKPAQHTTASVSKSPITNRVHGLAKRKPFKNGAGREVEQ